METTSSIKTSAIYAGSFDSFTNGHLEVVRKAAPKFDKLYIVIAISPDKKRRYTIDSSIQYIKDVIENEPYKDKIEVLYTDDILASFAAELGCNCMVRGLRNATDYAYEENYAVFSESINPNLDFVYIRARHFNHVSSSVVEELVKRGKDVSGFVPYPMDKLVRVNRE